MIFGAPCGFQRDPPRRAAATSPRPAPGRPSISPPPRPRPRAEMRDVGHGEAEMKPRGIPHRGFADRDIRMHRKRRLHIGEGRDDDAPDALDGVERQDAAMALDQAAHHVGLARRAERRADLLGLLHLDQPVDDVAALHQQAMHLLVDACRSPCAVPASEGGAGGRWDMIAKPAGHASRRRAGRSMALIRKDGR